MPILAASPASPATTDPAPLARRLATLVPDEAESRQTERRYLENQFNRLIEQLEAQRIRGRSAKKRIRAITTLVRGKLAQTPRPDADLTDLFRLGNYNDATLGLTYALLLEAFDLPWRAAVDHWQLYLVTDPAGKRQQFLNRADPPSRARRRGYRADYVELLNLTVLPGRRPRSAAGLDSLYFQYHYRPGELLDFRQLAAYWHYERALRAFYHRNYQLTIRRLGAAKQLERRPAFATLEQATYLQLANLEENGGQANLFYLFELWQKDRDNTYIPATLLTAFIRRTDDLIRRAAPDFGPGEQLYNYLYARGQDRPAWRYDLRQLYYLQKTRFAARWGRYDQVKNNVDSLYQMEPDNPIFRELAGELSLWTLRSTRARGEELRNELDEITHRYPFVRQYGGLNDLVLADLAREVRGYYEADQGYAGDSGLLRFRQQMAASHPGPRRRLWVMTAYLAASNYYFRLGDYRQALRLVEEGLNHSPDDDYLLHRAEVLRRY